MDWTFIILAAACVPLAALWWWRKRRIAHGLRCWNCNADLTTIPLYVDLHRKSRCPKCGNEMDVSDVYRLR
jgi:hypothetical protein